MLAENITFEISIRFFKGDLSDADFSELKDHVKKNFEKARIISQGSSEAKIISVKIINKEE